MKKTTLVPGKHRVKDEREVYGELIEYLSINHRGLSQQLRAILKNWKNIDT